jgi:hypothetical membrane protein
VQAAPDRADRLGAAAGWGSALVGLAGVGVAVAVSPWFSWTENALSDLGHPQYDSWGIFGASLIVSGALAVLFSWALGRRLVRGPLGAIAVACLAAGGASLAAVGAVNESYGFPHLLVSITYFTFEAAGVGLLGAAALKHDRRFGLQSLATGAVSGAFGVMVSTALVYGAPFPSQAIPELIASLIFAGWTVALARALWKGTPPVAPAPPQAAVPP